ncbi:MAG: hypothetical protein NZL99_06085 [Burkholderiaceae bacterium]|nr:hypothetical protein [Burkholderiaceae bacterium]
MATALDLPLKERLAAALRRVIELRRGLASDAALTERWLAVKRYQSERLRRTYADLLAAPRYRAAAEFFLDELYGEKDFEQRDQEALRVAPKMARLLPERAVETMTLAVELDELSEILDARVARAIEALPLDDAGYERAYRLAGTPSERARQIEMVLRIGRALDRLARMPLLAGMLHVMRGPAEAAGLAHLHHFLVRGFDAFRAMQGAGEFLALVEQRETALMRRLFETG